MFLCLFQIAVFQLFRIDEDSNLTLLTPVPKSKFVSGHESYYAWSDGDVLISETEAGHSALGW